MRDFLFLPPFQVEGGGVQADSIEDPSPGRSFLVENFVIVLVLLRLGRGSWAGGKVSRVSAATALIHVEAMRVQVAKGKPRSNL